jgi:hypothetical protein
MDDLVADLVLPAHAPAYIVSALETSRELVRHAFHRYEFGTVAVTHALVAVEHALGERCAVEPTFQDLITQAAAAGLVPPRAADLLQASRLLRGKVAHGAVTSAALALPRAVETVRAAFDTAALLFPAPAAAEPTTEDDGGTHSEARLARLWAEHRGAPFPASFRGVDTPARPARLRRPRRRAHGIQVAAVTREGFARSGPLSGPDRRSRAGPDVAARQSRAAANMPGS